MAPQTPICDFGWKAPDFSLPATDGSVLSLADVQGDRGTLVVFICNHCPYVKAIIERLIRDAADLADLGIGVAAICSNDADTHPEDGFGPMKDWAEELKFPFPYLHDEDQSVARAYDAVCTPDYFGFGGDLGLQYRGRLDASRAQPAAPDVRRDLYEAMKAIAETGHGPTEQISSMGCSIKWKAA